jgi:hypothetical protein
MAEMRPLIVADPMLRAPKPEIVAELYGASSAPKAAELTRLKLRKTKIEKRINYFEAGNLKIASSTETFGSALSMTIFCLSGSFLRPDSIENGK